VSVFEFAAFMAGAAFGALVARAIGLLDQLWRNL
jgi:hypothetical protein